MNHLIGVYERGPTTAAHFDANGVWNGPGPGPPTARFAYDGLGRLIKKQYRIGVGDIGGVDGERFQPMGFAHYIYDGARRVQEILRFPVAAPTGPAPPLAVQSCRKADFSVYGLSRR